MIYEIWGIQFAHAKYFMYLLPLLLIALALLCYRVWWQKKHADLLQGSRGQGPRLLRHFSLTQKILKALLLFAGLGSLILALATPQWDEAKDTVVQEGRDVLIALDISRSMLAQDAQPSRLEAAKRKIKELVSRFGVERVALMVFSGVPVITCPFTTDLSAFLSFLDLVDVEAASSGTTALDKALEKAVETFQDMATKKHKILIIFTDGEDFSPTLPATQEKIKKLGLSVFTVGVGTPEGAPIPLIDEQGAIQGHVKDETGSIVITRLNEPLLKKLSAETGARYIRASHDNGDIDQLVSDIKRFEKEKFEDKLISAKQEKYFLFALASMLCLLVEWLL